MPTSSQIYHLKSILITHRAKILAREIPWYLRAAQAIGFMQNETVLAINVLLAHLDPQNSRSRSIWPREYELLKQDEIGDALTVWEDSSGERINEIPKPAQTSHSVYLRDALSRTIISTRTELTHSLSNVLFRQRRDVDFIGVRTPAQLTPTADDQFYSPYLLHRDGHEIQRDQATKNNPLHEVLLPRYQEEYSSSPEAAEHNSTCKPNTAYHLERMEALDLVLQQIDNPEDCFRLFKHQALSNSPIMLAIKLGRWEMCEAMIAKAKEHLNPEQISTIMHQRDSKGLMSLSYALALRAPKSIIAFCLDHTDKQAYFTDNAWLTQPTFMGHSKTYDLSPFTIHEDGYYLGDIKMFSLYELSPIELYTQPLPDKINISNRQRLPTLADHQSMKISEQVDTSKTTPTPFRQILRNLIFHMRTLCISEQLPYQRSRVGIELSSGLRARFDSIENYPRLATMRNHPDRVDRDVCEMIDSWMSTPLHATVQSAQANHDADTTLANAVPTADSSNPY